ncbi:MAG: deoxynucleoside kinase [Chloroflexota bacterium]|nr:deoxynucleoside kinase [Chloroflexota bacterium]MDQ5868042.1 deoxynucleoside kinase [Chloroflexota bacterium]
MKYYIAVAGNIGVGKSSLTELLAERLGWEPFYEAVAENPYLSDFYGDMRRWSFHSQVFFLSRRLRHHYDLLNRPGSVIQDRSVYEDAEIFARNLYNGGNMSEADWQTYYDLYELATTIVRPPNLVVYLQATVPTLLSRIELRGRDFERGIQPEYIAQLNELYEDWTARFNLCPVLTINTDGMDFVRNPEHMEQIARRIRDRLQGKETITLHSP